MGTTIGCFERISKTTHKKQLCSHFPPISKPFYYNEQDMLGTNGEVGSNSLGTFSYGLLYTDTPALADQLKLTFINSVLILDAV